MPGPGTACFIPTKKARSNIGSLSSFKVEPDHAQLAYIRALTASIDRHRAKATKLSQAITAALGHLASDNAASAKVVLEGALHD